MKKSDLLHEIAQTGYNAGFGAKKSFASLDMVSKGPNVIGAVTMGIGVFSLVDKVAASPYVTAATIVVGAFTLYLGVQKKEVKRWQESGHKLTLLRDRLGILYGRVKAEDDAADMKPYVADLQSLRDEVADASEPDQVNFSGWYAHLKFFGEAQIKWISKELGHTFWRDKVPASLSLTVVAALILSLAYGLATVPAKIAVAREAAERPSSQTSEEKSPLPATNDPKPVIPK